jgi:lipoprotein signal peptidase
MYFTRVVVRGRPESLFASVALGIALLDLGAKRLAVTLLGESDLVFGERARLVIVHNPKMLAESWFGGGGPAVESIGVLLLIALMRRLCRPLSIIDSAAPYTLGLIAGAALGNTIDLLSSGTGVTDFFSLGVGAGSEVVFNLADVAAYVGAALAMRLSYSVARALVAERRRSRALVLDPSYASSAPPPRRLDAEVAIAVFAEDARREDATGTPRRERIVDESERQTDGDGPTDHVTH